MSGEYVEQKTRYYVPRKKKDGGKLERFAINPMMRIMGFKSKEDKGKKSRLTA